jgi:succinate dehydrogenase / fumarate reductase iron-sulfur subunit
MRVDGQEGLACVTKVGDAAQVTVEPLANLPVVSDLVVAMEPFYDELDPIDRPLSGLQIAPEACPVIDAYTLRGCIECGICLSACPIAGTDPLYVGPAAIAAAWRVVEEPRGLAAGPVVRLMDDEQALWRCHVAWECSDACPSGVDPAGAIARMRRAAIAARARRLFGRGGGG